MPGLTDDQIALYQKDMYKAQYESLKRMEPKHPDIFTMITGMTGAGDKETQLLGTGKLERLTTEGQDINFVAPVQGWTTQVRFWRYARGLTLTKEAVEDTVKGGNVLKAQAAKWSEYGTIAKENMAARVFNKGGDLLGEWVFNGTSAIGSDSSGDMLYDSIPLFTVTGNNHVTKGGGSYYNSTAGLTMTAGNFETTYNLHTVSNNQDEEGEIIGNPADTIVCLPGSDKFLAERIVDTSRGIPGSQLNDLNPYYGIIKDIIAWDYLDKTEAAFFVGKKQHPAFCFADRQAQELDFFRDRNNRGYKASVDMRFGVWMKVGSWRAWTRAGGSAA